MKIRDIVFVIATKENPYKFITPDSYLSTNIRDADFWGSAAGAERAIQSCMDEPEKFQALQVVITYNIEEINNNN